MPITMNGTCVVSVGNTFNYIYLRVFDVDNVSVIFDDNAVTTTEGNSPNWKTPIDPLTGKSAALAPPPWSVGLGQVKDFAIKADLYSMTGANLDNKTTWLVVDYRQPNP